MGMGGGKGGSKIEVAEYTIGMHMGICAYGEGLKLIAVKYADKEIWRGELTDATTVAINKPDLFGDVKKEGGVKGLLWWLPGKPTQVMPQTLAQRLGLTSATCPGFRGFSSIFLTGIADVVEGSLATLKQSLNKQPSAMKRGFYLASNNPYLRTMSVRVRRPSKGLNSAYALIEVESDSKGRRQYASNGVHIIYECMTNRDWGMGELESAFDKPAWEAAARTAFNEKYALNIAWTRQSEIQQFIGEVLNHIQAAVFVNPATGKHTIKLLRGDYNVATLPVIDPSNGVLSRFSRKAWGELGNEIVVTMTNPETGKTETVTVQDLAGIAAEGAVISSSRNYYGFASKATAQMAAERDLAASVNPIATCQAKVSREFWDAVSSDVVLLSWPEYLIEQIVFRVSEVHKEDNSVTLDLYEDIFGLDRASYLEADDTSWVNPSQPPVPANYYKIGTAPAFMAAQALGLSDPSELDYPEALAAVVVGPDSDDDVDFDLYSYLTDVNGVTKRASLGTRAYFGTFVTISGLTPEAQTLVPNLSGLRGNVPEAGDFIIIGTNGDEFSEIATVQEVDDNGYLLNRGMLDTIPREWPAGTRMFIIPADSTMVDLTVRSAFEATSYWFLTRTTAGKLALEDAPQVNVTLSQRAYRPNRPANVKVNGTAFGSVNVGTAALTVTWAIRNRIRESTQAFKWTEASIAGEAGQTTIVELRTPAGTLIKSYSALTGTQLAVPVADMGSNTELDIVVASTREGFRSLQSHKIRVNRTISP